MRSALWLSHVARHSFCKMCIDRYNTGVLRPYPVRRQTAMRDTSPKVIRQSTWYLRSGTRREWERSARAWKEREALALRRDLYFFQQVSHTFRHVRRRCSRSLSDISSRQCAVTFRHIRKYVLVGWRDTSLNERYESLLGENGKRGINLGSLKKLRDYRTSSWCVSQWNHR